MSFVCHIACRSAADFLALLLVCCLQGLSHGNSWYPAWCCRVPKMQPRIFHQPRCSSHLHSLPHRLLYRKARTRQVQAVPERNLHGKDRIQALHEVPHRLLLPSNWRQQMYVLPPGILYECYRRGWMRAVPCRNLFHPVRSRLEHHLRGVSSGVFQLQAGVNGVYALPGGTIH